MMAGGPVASAFWGLEKVPTTIARASSAILKPDKIFLSFKDIFTHNYIKETPVDTGKTASLFLLNLSVYLFYMWS
jgi:hypothetical protein